MDHDDVILWLKKNPLNQCNIANDTKEITHRLNMDLFSERLCILKGYRRGINGHLPNEPRRIAKEKKASKSMDLFLKAFLAIFVISKNARYFLSNLAFWLQKIKCS